MGGGIYFFPLLYMKEIIAKFGEIILVDDEDFEEQNQYSWYVDKDMKVERWIWNKDTKCQTIYMSREILKVKDPHIIVDHKDQNKLNMQKYNLREADKAENARNKGKQKGKYSSKYKGVTWVQRLGKWIGQIHIDGNRIHLGTFDTEVQAALAYNKAAIIYHKQFACLNKIEEK